MHKIQIDMTVSEKKQGKVLLYPFLTFGDEQIKDKKPYKIELFDDRLEYQSWFVKYGEDILKDFAHEYFIVIYKHSIIGFDCFRYVAEKKC